MHAILFTDVSTSEENAYMRNSWFKSYAFEILIYVDRFPFKDIEIIASLIGVLKYLFLYTLGNVMNDQF